MQCASCAVVMAVDHELQCCGVHKLLAGDISRQEVLEVFDHACKVVAGSFAIVDAHLKSLREIDSQNPDIPPKRLGLFA